MHRTAVPNDRSGTQESAGDINRCMDCKRRGWKGQTVARMSLEAMAAQCLQELRSVRPEDPYLLGGFSFGEIVAFEMAQQLHSAGWNDEAEKVKELCGQAPHSCELFVVTSAHMEMYQYPVRTPLDARSAAPTPTGQIGWAREPDGRQ